jgi:hypothetical protein
MAHIVLFTRPRSVYDSLGCNTYNEQRNALTYNGSLPVIAHPPCRGWGRFHKWAKVQPGELDLGHFAADVVRSVGGVLEHPEYSKLWQAAGLPPPGEVDEFGGYTVKILQSWFGHLAPKPTWLYVCGISRCDLPDYSPCLEVATGRIEKMSRCQRETTPVDLAKWLLRVLDRIKAPEH